MNQALNCVCVATAADEQVGREQKRLKYVPPGSGVGGGGGQGANDRGGAAPEAATARKLMPAPSEEPLLPASDAPTR